MENFRTGKGDDGSQHLSFASRVLQLWSVTPWKGSRKHLSIASLIIMIFISYVPHIQRLTEAGLPLNCLIAS